jgi:hypothetical protein
MGTADGRATSLRGLPCSPAAEPRRRLELDDDWNSATTGTRRRRGLNDDGDSLVLDGGWWRGEVTG